MKALTLAAALLAPIINDHTPGTPSTQASLRKGQLNVKLNSAPNLTDKDLFGNPGPFIEMWLDKNYKQRSKDAKGLNPVYNETFCFYVRPG
ncbi:hypothetical protein BGX33_005023 [Mortierella sp. NVP41]|nr:hypothetical protein BGX33_005023 [Mortierella sp. NVP41]